MASAENRLERLEFGDDFRLAVHQLLMFIENELGDGQHQVRPDDDQWRLQRAKTIGKLNELRAQLDKTCVAASYGKGVGIGAELIGDATTLLGCLMKLGDSPSAEAVMNFGALINHSGSLVEGASNVVENLISSQYLMEIEEVLKKDRELSRPFQDWLSFSRNLDANVREIFGCDLNVALQQNVLNVFSEFTMLHSRCLGFEETVDLMKRGRYSLDIDTTVPVEKLLRFSSQLEMHPELHSNILAICSTLCNSGRVIQVAVEGLRVYRNLVREDESSKTEREANDSLSQNRQQPPTLREVSAFCAFQAINIAVNVINLSSVIFTIKDGKSKYSHALGQISNLLAMELRSMEGL